MKKRILAIVSWTFGLPLIVFFVWVVIFWLWAYKAGGQIYVYDIVIWGFWGSICVSPFAGLVLGVCGFLPATKRGDGVPT